MNTQALVKDMYSAADVEQLVNIIENLLEVYTGSVIALFAAIVLIAILSALVNKRKVKARCKMMASSTQKPEGRPSASASQRERAFDRLSLSRSSIY